MKSTDIWTNHPNPKFLPMCKNGDSCHESAPEEVKLAHRDSKVARKEVKFLQNYVNI